MAKFLIGICKNNGFPIEDLSIKQNLQALQTALYKLAKITGF
jgi:hypothetical protein